MSLLAGVDYTMSLIAFYASASYFTKVGSKQKKDLEEDFKPGTRSVFTCSVGGQRTILQVFSNCGIGFILSLLIVLFPEMDPTSKYALRISYICHYCVCNGDTWASELGSIYGGVPRLVTSLAKVPPGTNGGLTPLGLLVSFLGGSFVSVVFHLTVGLTGAAPVFSNIFNAFLVGGFFGFTGSMVRPLSVMNRNRLTPSWEPPCSPRFILRRYTKL